MAKTLREHFVEALIARGEKQLRNTTKFLVFSRKEGGFYYVGKSGSLRFGPIKTASIPCSEKFKNALLENIQCPTIKNLKSDIDEKSKIL